MLQVDDSYSGAGASLWYVTTLIAVFESFGKTTLSICAYAIFSSFSKSMMLLLPLLKHDGTRSLSHDTSQHDTADLIYDKSVMLDKTSSYAGLYMKMFPAAFAVISTY